MAVLHRMVARVAVVVCTVLALSQFSFLSVAHADTVTITPPRFELFGNPGDTITEKIKVRNDGPTEGTYQAITEDFKAGDDEGSVALQDDPDAPRTSFSLASWISVEPKRFTIPSNEEKVINVTIRVPKSGEPGGHYASVLIAPGSVSTEVDSASVESRVGSLLLLRVSGAITEKLNVGVFKASESYYQKGPVDFELRTTNEGNVHVAPVGTIVITNIFGKKVKELPLTTANVLPGSSRIVRTSWDDKGLPGRYTATLVASYGQGDSKQNITATTSFIVFPVYLIVIVIAALVLIVLILKNRKKFKKILHSLTSD